MHSRLTSTALSGIDARPVEVEVDLSPITQQQTVSIVGLPDTAVRESKKRVRSAIENSQFMFPHNSDVTVNLAPADVPKEGSLYDLPVAVGILCANEVIDPRLLEEYAIVGELALDGRVRPVDGMLSQAMAVREEKLRGIIVPEENAREAAVVDGIEVVPVQDLAEAVGFLNGEFTIEPVTVDMKKIFQESVEEEEADFSDVRGQEHVKRALTIAAAGGHNVLMIGPPGSGKTMLSRRLTTILPGLTLEEALETTRVHSITGNLSKDQPLLTTRPFQAPHHSISSAGLAGGGTTPAPGAISMAHNGVLFLDELPEFSRSTLEVLRQPLEEGEVTIGRAAGTATFPANVMLVAAMNPCPCGFQTEPRKECECTPHEIKRYRSRISGPLLDRIDIHVEVPAVEYEDLSSDETGTSSRELRQEVETVRNLQARRFEDDQIRTNAKMNNKRVKSYCHVGDDGERILKEAIDQLGLSARAYMKVLKLSRTISDMDRKETIQPHHITEAVQYRSLDRQVMG